MRVSQQFGIAGTQGSLDFIDVDTSSDTPLFIDPAALAYQAQMSPWAAGCASAVQSYFQAVLDRVVAKDAAGAQALMGHLHEENATHLGFSRTSSGSGMGPGLARRFYAELSGSKAVASGLINDLEDTALLVEGVRADRISDVITNVIRNRLAEYTYLTSQYHGIPLTPNVALGAYWDVSSKAWTQGTFDVPMVGDNPLLLVPKSIVRKSPYYDPGAYYRHYVLNFFWSQELSDPNSSLAVLVKGQRHVFKGSVEEKVRRKHRTQRPGIEKRVNADATQQDPNLLAKFKKDREAHPASSEPHAVIAGQTGLPEPDFDALLSAVTSLKPGAADAVKYERAIEALLGALLYPSLVNPIRQEAIHGGRKRIDISFTNAPPRTDFFYWLALNFPAANVVAECKNYSRPLANPEYDQISGRFSPSRGRFGLLVYRSMDDKAKVFESLRDTARDDRGWIIPLDDDDLALLVAEAKAGSCTSIGGWLHEQFKALIA